MPVLAIGAIVLEVLIIAIMAILLTYALELFAKAVAQIIPGFSIPGLGSLRDKIISGIGSAIGAVKSLASSSMAPMVNILRDPVVWFQTMYNAVYTVINEVITTGQWIISTAIPRAETAVTNYANQLYNQAIANTLSVAGQLRADYDGLYNAAINHANDLYNQAYAFALAQGTAAINHANALYNQAIAAATAQYNTALTHADGLYNQAIAFATSGVASAVAHANALAATLSAQAQTLYNQAIGYAGDVARAGEAAAIATVTGPLITDLPGIWPGIVDEIDGIIDTAGDDFADAIANIKGLDLTLPVSVGGALAIAIPAISALTKLANDCTIPNCRNLSGVGRELQSLFGIVEDGLLFAFIAELVHDPAAGVSLVENVLGGLADDAVTVGRAMVGI